MDPKPPNRITGCFFLYGGCVFAPVGGAFVVAGGLGLAGVLRVQNNGPEWVFLLFGGAACAGGAVMLRFGWWHLTGPRPERPKAIDPAFKSVIPVLVPVVGGFVLTGLLSFAGVIVARFVFNAPGWLTPVVFFAPPVLFMVLARPAMRTLVARMARAVPSPESRAVAPPAEGPDGPIPVPNTSDPTPMSGDWPTVPADDTQPGRVLAHALEPDDVYRGCTFGCAVFGTLVWNGILSVFVWPAAKNAARGVFDWRMLFLVPFVLVGLGLIGFVFYSAFRWVVSLLVGTVEAEVSAHPFVPGGRYGVHIAQRGRFPLGAIAGELVCEEKATYAAGTQEQTATHVAARQSVLEAGGLPAAADFELAAGAMHSFAAPKNAIVWTLRVTGRVFGVLPYSERFPLVVRPHPVGESVVPDAPNCSAAPSTGPEVLLELTGSAYRPGEEVSGAFVIPGGPPPDAESVELSVLWHTSGKGTEDLGVIHYRAWKGSDGSLPTMPNPCPFAAVLPRSPLSYDGTVVKIHWVARLRVRYGRTGEVVYDVPFTLSAGGPL